MEQTGIQADSLSDNALMRRVGSGDVRRLGILYERHNGMLFGFFYRNTGDRETSADLVQTVFYRVLKYRGRFRNEGKFTTWLFSIAHNALCDHYRKNRRRHDPLDEIGETMVSDDDADGAVLAEETSTIVRAALDRLTEEQREVLILSRFHDMKYAEIADVLNISEGAVKSRVFRAVSELKTILEKQTDRS